MKAPNEWQHDTVVQTLYSARGGFEEAGNIQYSLAQARTDVFFSLLFGGRIVCSAGAFFDSPIAIRVFGELFAHPDFDRCCEIQQWYPLRISTDNPKEWTAKDYLVDRLTGPKSLTLFREDDPEFEAKAEEGVVALKHRAAEHIRLDDYAGLSSVYQPFLKPYKVGRLFVPEMTTIGLRQASAHTTVFDEIDPVLTEDFAFWIRSILRYLDGHGLCRNMDPVTHREKLCLFSPLAAVKTRTEDLSEISTGDYSMEELTEMNKEFERGVGELSEVNAFHVNGKRIYRHYYNLVNYWLDMDWHSIRHVAYGSANFLLSTRWTDRAVFDFDTNAKPLYLNDSTIDDSVRRTQEELSELDWGILLRLVSNVKWQRLIASMKMAKTRTEADAYADEVIDLLSSAISDFEFQSETGAMSILMRKVVNPLAFKGGAHLFASHFHLPSGGLTSMLGNTAVSFLSETKVVGGAAPLIAGARKIHRHLVRRQLRSAIVPRLYLRRVPDENAKKR